MQRHKPRQIIVTTHSYDILSNEGIDETEVVLLLNSDEGTLAKTVDEMDEVKEVLDAGLSMADAVLPVTRPIYKILAMLVWTEYEGNISGW